MNRRVVIRMVLTFLCGVSDERAEKLLQLLASARRACHVASLMLFQCHDDQ